MTVAVVRVEAVVRAGTVVARAGVVAVVGITGTTLAAVAPPQPVGIAALIASHASGYWHPAIDVAAPAVSC